MIVVEEVYRGLGGVTVIRECDSPHGGVKSISKVCQFYGEV